jgi:hypothetical protein
MLATAAVLGVACFWLLTPRRGHSRILQTRTDTQTVSSAVMQYAIDNVTCPKSIKALNGGYLSNSTRVLDAWDEPLLIYCSLTGDGVVGACSNGPNRHHGDDDDVCNLDHRRHESSLMRSAPNLVEGEEPSKPEPAAAKRATRGR